MGLVFHQHLHALHVGAPELQAVLHPLDLRANQDTRVLRPLGITAPDGAVLNFQLILSGSINKKDIRAGKAGCVRWDYPSQFLSERHEEKLA